VAATATEHGKTLPSDEELFPLFGKLCHAFIASNVGTEATAELNNHFALLASETDDGHVRMMAIPGYMEAEFDGPDVVRRHSASRLASLVLARWVDADDGGSAARLELEAASTTKMDNETTLLTDAQKDEAGIADLNPFGAEVAMRWERRRPKSKRIPAELVRMDEAYRARVNEAVAAAARRIRRSTASYTDDLDLHGRALLNIIGPAPARGIMDHALSRVESMLGTLTKQRADLQQDLAIADEQAAGTLADLDDRLSGGGLYWRHRKLVHQAIEVLTELHALSYARSLTEEAIKAVAAAREQLTGWRSSITALSDEMRGAAASLANTVVACDERVFTGVDELINRQLADAADRRALFAECVSGTWDEPDELVLVGVRTRIGPLDRWLDRSGDEIRAAARDACIPVFDAINSMSVDDFLRWKCQRTGTRPEAVLRDLISLAFLLYRVDRSRLPERDALYDGEFAVVGVPDRDKSLFVGCGLGRLRTTGDTTRISVLRLKLGVPATALYDYDQMQEAHARVRATREVVVDIYPELLCDENGSGPQGSRRERRSSGKGRRR
jgi:hypothetical protein